MVELADGAGTLWELVRLRAEATPGAPLLLTDAGTTLSCAEFADRAERVAAGLHELGVGPGTPVSWQLPTRPETVVLSAALARLGAVQNPIIHIYREREVGFALRQTGAELLCVPGEWRGTDFAAMGAKLAADLPVPPRVLVTYDELPEGDPAGLPPPPAAGSGDDVRWIYYTSGTTSEPKGVRHSDSTLLAAGTGLALALGAGPGDVGSIAFPFAHIGGPDYLVMMLAAGFPALLLEAFEPASAVGAYRRAGVTIAGGSTAFYSAVIDQQLAAGAAEPVVPTLRLLAGGGAPKPPELYFQCLRDLGVKIAHGYGMTEIPMITQGSPVDSDEQLAHTEGAPIRGITVRIVGPDGAEVPVGTEGEVRVRGSAVCHGYTDPALDADAFDDAGWFRTGDLGVLRPDGHVTLTGRLKDVIIRKGENVSAKEIEDLLFAHPAVGAVAVIGLPDPERGERVCAVVEPVAGAAARLGFDEMAAYLGDAGLARQKIPEQLEVVDALPRNATFKILKHVLRDRYS